MKRADRRLLRNNPQVASRAEAWIETYASKDHTSFAWKVASRAEAWIETRAPAGDAQQRIRRLPCGGVD